MYYWTHILQAIQQGTHQLIEYLEYSYFTPDFAQDTNNLLTYRTNVFPTDKIYALREEIFCSEKLFVCYVRAGAKAPADI
jgi:hypothetical protein